MKMITIITILSAVVCGVSMIYSGLVGKVIAEKIGCSNFKTKGEAQAAYDLDAIKYARLDGYDRDGRVCENLPKYPKK